LKKVTRILATPVGLLPPVTRAVWPVRWAEMSGRLACLAAMLRMLFLTTWYSAPWVLDGDAGEVGEQQVVGAGQLGGDFVDEELFFSAHVRGFAWAWL